VADISEGLRSEYLEEISSRTLREEGEYLLDYVRLTVKARS
jgi:hypothetical protein